VNKGGVAEGYAASPPGTRRARARLLGRSSSRTTSAGFFGGLGRRAEGCQAFGRGNRARRGSGGAGSSKSSHLLQVRTPLSAPPDETWYPVAPTGLVGNR